MLTLVSRQKQALKLAPGQLQGLKLLAKSLPELRTELMAQIAANPAIEDIDHPLETPLSEVEARRKASEIVPDYPENDFEPGTNFDEEAAERRQAFFDNQVREETLQQHLVAQFPFSDIAPGDYEIAEVLVGELDGNGRFIGSLPDLAMGYGKSMEELEKVLAEIRELDPPGCGARNPRECLLSQMDKLDKSPYRDVVRRMIEDHFEAIGTGRLAEVEKALGLTHGQYVEALKTLRTLEAYPGRQYPNERDRVEYLNPEVHAVRRDGAWLAVTDRRSLPEIRLSREFLEQLKSASLKPEEREQMKAYVEEARQLREIVAERRDTVEAVAQAIFDRQPEFFVKGLRALVPMTEGDVAADAGLSAATVSRTVCDKYASTPFGTVELRRFFSTGLKTADGETVSQVAAIGKLKDIVAGESKANPYSDQKLAELMKAAGFPIARRTIAKYRDRASIPPASERRQRN